MANATLRKKRPVLETLEDRTAPATFGVPWQDPSRLTISFAPDGTPIAGHASSLFRTLDAQAPIADWQRQILRAFQTWAVQANINIGLVADGGQAFGTAGPAQHDPRFGDIRVGAQPMTPEALSISVPNDPTLSSTWNGDVLINANDAFGPQGLDLVSVLMHEAGHVLGLGDGTDPSSPMNAAYDGITQPTPADITALQALYGTRPPDAHEGSSGNDTMSRATQVPFPGGYTGATPLVEYGDVTTSRDVDYYAVKPPSNDSGPITVELTSAGISLLTTRLTITDDRGNVLGTAQAASDFGDTVTLHLDQSSPNTTYYLRVEGATQDPFGIGGYALAVTFDAANMVAPSALDAVLRGPYQSLSPNDIAALFQNPDSVFFNDDGRGDGGPGSATTLAPSPGFARSTHYETVASISGPSDVDSYRIQPPNVPNGQNLVLTATVRAVAPNGAAPRVTIFGRDHRPIRARILANGDGVYTIQAGGLKSGGNYVLNVSSGGSASGVGNYHLEAVFGSAAANLTTFAGGSLGPSTPQRAYHFYVGESQLFQLLLSTVAPAAPAGTAVRMTIADHRGRIVGSLTAAAGNTVSGNALFLAPGAYTLRFKVLGGRGGHGPAVGYSLAGEAISDPIGPVIDDPTLTPMYQAPSWPGMFLYPGSTITPLSYFITLWANLPPPA